MHNNSLYEHFCQLLELDSAQQHDYLRQFSSEPELRTSLLQLINEHQQNQKTLWKDLIFSRVSELTGDARLEQLVGCTVGKYRLLRILGQGGMGMVYLAERVDGLLSKQVAIKLLYPSVSAALGDGRAHQEVMLLSKLNHPNIVKVFDAGFTDEGWQYFVMEYIEGIAIDLYARQQQLSDKAVVRLFLQLAEAIAAAHALQIVHGDIKPANIMVTAEGQVKVLDFGIASQLFNEQDDDTVIRHYLRAFSRDYAAPEQVEHGKASMSSDQYSLAIVLSKLLELTLAQPLASSIRLKVKSAFLHWNSTQLHPVIKKACLPEPKERFSTVALFNAELWHYLGHIPLQHQGHLGWTVSKWVFRNPLLALFLLTFSCTSVILAWQNNQIRQERLSAQQVAFHLSQMFRQTDPTREGDSRITGKEILQRGYEAVVNDLQLSQPVRLELLDVLGESMRGIGEYENAFLLYQRLFREQLLSGKMPAQIVVGYAKASQDAHHIEPLTKELRDWFEKINEAELQDPELAEAFMYVLDAVLLYASDKDQQPEILKRFARLSINLPEDKKLEQRFYTIEYELDIHNKHLTEKRWDKANWQQHRKLLRHKLEDISAAAGPLHELYPFILATQIMFYMQETGARSVSEYFRLIQQQLDTAQRLVTQKFGAEHSYLYEFYRIHIVMSLLVKDTATALHHWHSMYSWMKDGEEKSFVQQADVFLFGLQLMVLNGDVEQVKSLLQTIKTKLASTSLPAEAEHTLLLDIVWLARLQPEIPSLYQELDALWPESSGEPEDYSQLERQVRRLLLNHEVNAAREMFKSYFQSEQHDPGEQTEWPALLQADIAMSERDWTTAIAQLELIQQDRFNQAEFNFPPFDFYVARQTYVPLNLAKAYLATGQIAKAKAQLELLGVDATTLSKDNLWQQQIIKLEQEFNL